jgi:hypothetical protein
MQQIARFPRGITIKELFDAFSQEIRFSDLQEAVDHLVTAKKLDKEKNMYRIAKGR